jgi:hypothetical protein
MMATNLTMTLPASLAAERQGDVAVLRLARPQKRNALDDETIIGIETFFTSLPEGVGAVLLHGEGEHFSAGLDLSELKERDITQGIAHSGLWHRAFDKIQFGKVPVVAVLHGAVVGGGLELAAAAHVRVAERSAYYALPKRPRNQNRWRRLGSTAAADRYRTNDGHDAHGSRYSAERARHRLTTYLWSQAKVSKGLELAQRIAATSADNYCMRCRALPK